MHTDAGEDAHPGCGEELPSTAVRALEPGLEEPDSPVGARVRTYIVGSRGDYEREKERKRGRERTKKSPSYIRP